MDERTDEILGDATGRRYWRDRLGRMPGHLVKGCTAAGLDRERRVYWDSHAATWIILTDDESAILVEIDPRAATAALVESFIIQRAHSAARGLR